tara:strand:+ start:147 stop:1640 length:1494 start_codon:yes stop_codon:yes gene_type:complete
MAFEIFGFKIERKSEERPNANVPAFALPENDDGSVMFAGGGAYGSYLNMEGEYKNEVELIYKYREMSSLSDCEVAIENVVNEAIVAGKGERPVNILLDNLNLTESIKTKIRNEFDVILDLLNFNNFGHEVFRRWYIEGRLYYHIMIDENDPSRGIVELRSLDATKIKKITQVNKEKKQDTINVKVNEVFNYNPAGLNAQNRQGILISRDSIAYCTSGLLDKRKKMVLSYLHKAIKPLNQLRMVEDAIVIYRISRAPERRIFYIDVGNLPKVKAEQYIRDIMTRYKNRLVYDSESGEVRDDRRHQSMLEDYWLPRREGGRGTEITTLPGGENLGQLDDVQYFQKKLYKAMHVPVSRLEADSGFSLGRESEITRDELLFSKFVHKLQIRFSSLFQEVMEKQLILKKIMTSSEWNAVKDNIQYDFTSDHFYTELKHQEIMNARMTLARDSEDFVGKYYSKEWFRTNILRQTEEEAQLEDERIESENESEMENVPSDDEDN